MFLEEKQESRNSYISRSSCASDLYKFHSATLRLVSSVRGISSSCLDLQTIPGSQGRANSISIIINL